MKKAKIFRGEKKDVMPKLLAEGRVPASVSDLMRMTIDGRFFNSGYFESGDAIIYDYLNDRIKINCDSETLRGIDSQTEFLISHNFSALPSTISIPLTSEQYKEIPGEEFDGEELKKMKIKYVLYKKRHKEELKALPILKSLARDQGLLEEYVDFIFREGSRISASISPIDKAGVNPLWKRRSYHTYANIEMFEAVVGYRQNNHHPSFNVKKHPIESYGVTKIDSPWRTIHYNNLISLLPDRDSLETKV